jgi:hypothetical protein
MDKMSDTIPVDVQEKMLLVADHLPPDRRAKFLETVSRETMAAIADHPRTLVYGALGWVLGEILDHLLTFRLPWTDVAFCLTAHHASELGAAAGMVKGFMEDRRAIAQRDQMSHAVARAIKEALA